MTAPAFVQAVASGWVSGSPASPTIAAALAGDLIAVFGTGRGTSAWATPAGYRLARAAVGPEASTLWTYVWYKAAAGGETSVPVGAANGDLWSVIVGTYRLAGVGAWAVDTSNGNIAGPSAGPTNPSITPTAGLRAVLLAVEGHDPNYLPAAPASYTQRTFDNGGSTPRTLSTWNDRLVDPTTGSYAGTYSGAGGETGWSLQQVAFVPATSVSFTGEPGGGIWARALDERIRRLWSGWSRRPSGVLAPS